MKLAVKVKLKKAVRIDFMQVVGYKQSGGKKWGALHGVPYWLINSKGIIENKNYIFDELTDLKSFSDYLVRQQVLIIKNKK
jgi:hypothetical protein